MGPSISVIKTLFALSGNTCSYERCEAKLTDPGWKEVNCDIAHIRGERPSAARYDSAMTDEDRHAFDNLMLLCPGCHRLIDRLAPSDHPVDRLLQMKHRHEQHADFVGPVWPSDDAVHRLAVRALVSYEIRVTLEQAQDILGEYRSQLADARAESARIIEEARQAADSVKADLQARAEEDVADLRKRATEDIQQAKAEAIRDLDVIAEGKGLRVQDGPDDPEHPSSLTIDSSRWTLPE